MIRIRRRHLDRSMLLDSTTTGILFAIGGIVKRGRYSGPLGNLRNHHHFDLEF